MDIRAFKKDIKLGSDILFVLLRESTDQLNKDAKLANCSLMLQTVPKSIDEFVEKVAQEIGKIDSNDQQLQRLNYGLDIVEEELDVMRSKLDYAELISKRVFQKVWFRLNWSGRV